MNKWNKTLELKDVWNNVEWTDENVHELGKIIATRLKRLYKDYEDYDKYGGVLEDLILAFEDSLTIERADEINSDNEQWCLENGQEFVPITPLEDFNNVMAELYDWADGERLWINKY